MIDVLPDRLELADLQASVAAGRVALQALRDSEARREWPPPSTLSATSRRLSLAADYGARNLKRQERTLSQRELPSDDFVLNKGSTEFNMIRISKRLKEIKLKI